MAQLQKGRYRLVDHTSNHDRATKLFLDTVSTDFVIDCTATTINLEVSIGYPGAELEEPCKAHTQPAIR